MLDLGLTFNKLDVTVYISSNEVNQPKRGIKSHLGYFMTMGEEKRHFVISLIAPQNRSFGKLWQPWS